MNGRMDPLAVVMVASVVASCAGKPDDLTAYLDDVRSRPATPLESLPQTQEPEEFDYLEAGRRSPFTPLARGSEAPRVADEGRGPDPAREREVLENYSLDTLRMVGSLSSEAGRFALVQTPDGLVHLLAEGGFLGRDHGRVTHVATDEVRLVELVADEHGGHRQRPAALLMDD